MNFLETFLEVVSKNKDKIAIVDNDGKNKTTYEELDILSDKIADKIHSLNIKKGSYIVIHMARTMEYLATYLGIMKAGCVVVLTSLEYPKERVDYIYNNSDAVLLINKSFLDDISKYDKYFDLSSDFDPAVIIYTSGSTGNPKGIVYTNYDLELGQKRVQEIMEVEENNFAYASPMSFASHVFIWTALALGGTVYIVPDATCKSSKGLEEFFIRNNITNVFLIPQMVKLLSDNIPSLKSILAGGERLSNIEKKSYKIYCVYGMTEVAGLISYFLLDKEYDNTPIGHPFKGYELIVVDEKDNIVPQGVEGEICLLSNLHTEYFKDEERTSRIMKKLDNGKVMYHTGDVGYLNNEGELVYINRVDWMIKINGQRVESLEVENVMRKIDGVKDAVVKAFNDSGKTYLVGYYVLESSIDKTYIKKEMSKKLPDYMMPSFLVELKELPKNMNGKVDRKSLLPPDINEFKAKYKAPSTEEEALLVDGFERILLCGKIGINDDFFLMGGDSIKVIKLLNIVNIKGLNTSHIYEGKTVKGILELLNKTNKESYIHYDSLKDSYPLTSSQIGVYLDSINDLNTLKYNIPFMIEIPSNVKVEELKDAIIQICKKHNALNICIKNINGLPSMVRKENEIIFNEVENCDIEKEKQDFIKPFDLENGPLYRFEIVNDKYLLLDFHHLIFDGTSLEVFIKEIASILNKDENALIELEEELNLFDVSLNENSDLNSNLKKEAIDFFDSKFNSLETDSTIISDIITNDDVCDDTVLEKELSKEIKFDDVTNYIKKLGITESSFFSAAFAYSLAKFNGANESFFTTVYNGRTDKRLENSIGMFVRTLPLYVCFDELNEIKKFLQDYRTYYYQTISNDCLSFSDLANKYGFNNNTSFVYQSELFNGVMINDELLIPTLLDPKEAVGNFNLMLMKETDGFKVSFHYNPKIYSKELINSFIDLYEMVIKGFLSKRYLKDIVLSSEQNNLLIEEFNKSEEDYDANKLIVERFIEKAKEVPSNICLVSDNNKYTYKQVDEISNQIAYFLLKNNLPKEGVVGICVGRNEFMLLCALGVLKAGGAYLPLDPTYPVERLNYMLDDSKAVGLIHDEEFGKIFDNNFKGFMLNTNDIKNLKEEKVDLPVIKPNDLFVVIYTSGSTGNPKGVMFEHANALVTVVWEQKFYEMGEDTHATSYASFGFDANVYDMYPPIISGGELHIIKEDLRLDFVNLVKYFNENKITDSVMTTQVARQFAKINGLTTLRHLSSGGEKLPPMDPPTSFKFYNVYGPTEGSIITSYQLIDKYYNDIPIGKVVDNLKAYIVDGYDRVLPVGAVGELWISGPHVTRGYLNNIEKTMAAYGNNNFIDKAKYERIYKTGDVIRYLSDGSLQFIGRRDSQVKIRGYRIELKEVEEVISKYPEIDDLTVVSFENKDGGKYIVAYIVSKNKVDIQDLKNYIASKKPSYMVPSIIMQIDKIPLNQNQKVNKKALPIPEKEHVEIVKPETKLQEEIYEIVSEIIGDRSFGIDTDLTLAGLTSIGIVKLNVSLAEKFNVAIKIADIKENNTIKLLEKFINNSSCDSEYEIKNIYPLTKTQEGIFVECSSNPNTCVYNIPLLFKLDNNVNIAKLKKSLIETINSHPYLKSTISMDENGDVNFNRNDDLEVIIEDIEIDNLPEINTLVKPFKLLGGTLYNIRIYRIKDANYLFSDFHHIVSDGTSLMILFEDLNKAYNGEILVKEKYSGYELSLEEQRIIESEEYKKALEFWKNTLVEIEECVPKKEKDSTKGAGAVTINSNVNTNAVLEFVNDNGITVNALFNGVFSFVLSRFTGFDTVNFATIHNGRSSSRFSKTISMMVKTIPVVSNIDGDNNVVDFLKSMKDYLMNAMMNDAVSFIDLSNKFNVKADIMFAYQGDDMDIDTICNTKANRINIPFSESKTPLSLNVYLKDGVFEYVADYNKEYYNDAFVNAFVKAFDASLASFLNVTYLKDVTMNYEEGNSLYDKLNDTDYKLENKTVVDYFEDVVKTNPEKTAVISRGISLTFEELNNKVNDLANKLISLGVKQDEKVGIVLDRSVNTLVSELGVMKSGAAYINALISYPHDRIDYCFMDASVRFVITDSTYYQANLDLFKDKPYKAILIDEELSGNICNPNVKINMNSLAYCIYTSGSTGKPKGVMIEHHNLTNLIQTYKKESKFISGDYEGCCLACCSVSFDASIFDTFIPICHNKTLVISTDEEYHNPLMFKKLILDNNVRHFTATPAFLTNLVKMEEMREAFKNLITLEAGAEVFPKALYDDLRKINKDIEIVNVYGPSECTVASTQKILTDGDNITIGGPTGNIKVYVIDKFGHILPPYAIGELLICGECVGRGYVNLEERTKQSFVEFNGLKAYHSGDIVRLNKNCDIDFGGRVDNQVKLRGFRIELDEIEKVMSSFKGIRQTKVIVRNNGSEDYLAGFFTADNKVNIDELTSHLKTSLTSYMVPAVLMQLDAMPLTPNGKIDKKALPEVKNVVTRSKSRKEARKSLEEKICEMYKKVLNLEEVYVDDGFFELGGTSLSASKITMMLMSEGIEVKYGDIFDNPTPYALTNFIESRNKPKEEIQKTDNVSNTREALKYNTVEYANKVVRTSLGNVLLTGAVGFLGIHILKELIDSEDGKIYCLVRKGVHDSALIRLKTMLFYYFSENFDEVIKNRITVIDADITDKNLEEILANYPINTIINCAACVKHFSDNDILDRINVHGVENLIEISKKHDYKLIQISTASVPGIHTKETFERQVKLHENELFVIDDMDNKYCISKYNAELKMFDAIENGLKGKVIRVGNLMGRHSDGEFQVNYESNMFLSGIRGFATMGMYPISHMTDPMKFSPIDCTAKAVVLLSGTNDMFTAFNADNRYGFDEMKIIDAVNKCNIKIVPTEDEEYYALYQQKLGDDKVNSKLNGLAAYDVKGVHSVETDNQFTVNILYRIGFSWPLIDDEYLIKAMRSMFTLDYFDLDNEDDE